MNTPNPAPAKAQFKIDMAWISSQVRDEKTVEAFNTTAVALANLVADLAKYLTEDDVAPLRERIGDTVLLLGEVLPLVSPPAKPKDVVIPVEEPTQEPAPTVDVDPQPSFSPTPKPTPKAPAKPLPPQATNKAVNAVLGGMGMAGSVAAKAMGMAQAAAPQAAPQVAPQAAPQVAVVQGSTVHKVREASLVRVISSKLAAPNAALVDPDPSTSLATSALVQNVLGGQTAASEYEAAVILAEIWRKA